MHKTQLSSSLELNFKLSLLKYAVVSLFLVNSLQLHAADVEKEFYLTSEITHLSNPNLAANNKSPVTVLRVAPEFNLTVGSELNRYYLNTLLSVYRNSNEDVLPNRENPSINLGWERTLSTGLFGIRASYVEDVALTQLLTTAGTAAGNNSENQIKTKTLGANWDHEFNARFSIENDITYSDVSFSEDTATLVEYTTLDFAGRLLYHNTENLSTYAQLGFLQFDPDSDVSNTNISRARLGAIFNPLDGLKLDGNAGYYKATGSSSFNGGEAQVIATYERDRVNYNFSASKLVTATGLNQVQKTTSFVLGASYLLSELNTIGAEFNSTNNKNADSLVTTNTDVRTKSLAAFFERTLKDWKFRANAKFIQLDNGVTSNANEIGVTAIYGPLVF